MVKDKSGEGGQAAVALDQMYDGVKPNYGNKVGLLWHVEEVSHRK